MRLFGLANRYSAWPCKLQCCAVATLNLLKEGKGSTKHSANSGTLPAKSAVPLHCSSAEAKPACPQQLATPPVKLKLLFLAGVVEEHPLFMLAGQ
eukprot:scaffold57004_cov19-Tisochrysis_lutea.AAC.1